MTTDTPGEIGPVRDGDTLVFRLVADGERARVVRAFIDPYPVYQFGTPDEFGGTVGYTRLVVSDPPYRHSRPDTKYPSPDWSVNPLTSSAGDAMIPVSGREGDPESERGPMDRDGELRKLAAAMQELDERIVKARKSLDHAPEGSRKREYRVRRLLALETERRMMTRRLVRLIDSAN